MSGYSCHSYYTWWNCHARLFLSSLLYMVEFCHVRLFLSFLLYTGGESVVNGHHLTATTRFSSALWTNMKKVIDDDLPSFANLNCQTTKQAIPSKPVTNPRNVNLTSRGEGRSRRETGQRRRKMLTSIIFR